uniref:Uncharacterized protein n=1 Tax=Manihot esculenta TaxID=3983 RepID=A0A2C9UPK3_MANES
MTIFLSSFSITTSCRKITRIEKKKKARFDSLAIERDVLHKSLMEAVKYSAFIEVTIHLCSSSSNH